MYVGHVISQNSVVIVLSNDNPITVPKENKRYDVVVNALTESRWDDAVEAANIALGLERRSGGRYQIVDGVVHVGDSPMPDGLSKMVIRLAEEGEETAPLEKFWINLKQNPSADSRKDLFDFLMVNDMPITPDGYLVAYKYVTKEYKDCWSGKYDNTPGNRIHMKRSEVDPDRNNTCSRGLHVAAFGYVENAGGKIVMCEVHPKDVVTVPPDYDQQKMRICDYRVVGDADGEYKDAIYYHNFRDEAKKPEKKAKAKPKAKAKGKTAPKQKTDVLAPFTATTDKENRLSINAAIVKALGATRDGKLRALMGGSDSGGALYLAARRGWDKRTDKMTDTEKRYKVRHRGVRVNLNSLFATKTKTFKVTPSKDFIKIEVS